MPRHIRNSCSASSYPIDTKILGIEKHGLGDAFEQNVNINMRDDPVTNLIKGDQWLMILGRFYFAGKNRDPAKVVGTVKTVRSELTQLARLYLQFITIVPNAELSRHDLLDMFNHKHHGSLMTAINILSNKKENLKQGLKLC